MKQVFCNHQHEINFPIFHSSKFLLGLWDSQMKSHIFLKFEPLVLHWVNPHILRIEQIDQTVLNMDMDYIYYLLF